MASRVSNGSALEALLPVHNQQEEGITHKASSKELIRRVRTVHNMSSSSLRKKSDMTVIKKVRWSLLRNVLANLQEVFLGTKLCVMFPAIPLAIAADIYHFGSGWLFALSLLGLTPLAERVSFVTEQVAYHTGPTVGGLLNATCGNVTELIIALFALYKGKIDVVKYSLVGSILSNLLLVLGSSLFIGGVANLTRHPEQTFDRRQADVGMCLLVLGVLCHVLPLLFKFQALTGAAVVGTPPTLALSRCCSVIMLIGYGVYILFQLKTHRQLFESEEDDEENDDVAIEEKPVMGLVIGIVWLVGLTVVIALLSEYVVSTIEEASESWGLSVSFNSIILLAIVGNAAEHAGALIFAYKNKLDIALGVSLGSAAQISVFVIPFSVLAAWAMGVPMDLDLNILETASLMIGVLLTSITLHDGTSHYLKGLVLLLAYIVIGACFFVLRTPLTGSTMKGGNESLEIV